MMTIRKYNNINEAKNMIIKSRKYTCITHDFPAGTYVYDHFHPKANEWVIVDNGQFTAALDYKIKEFDITQATAIKFPAGHIHSLKTISDVSYHVIRDCEDKTLFISTLLRQYKKNIEDLPLQDRLYEDDTLVLTRIIIPQGELSYDKLNDYGKSTYLMRKGTGRVIVNNEVLGKLIAKSSINIEQGDTHKIVNLGKSSIDTLLIEYKK